MPTAAPRAQAARHHRARHHRARHLCALLALVAAVGLLGGLAATPASAHAGVESTDPPDGVRLPEAPTSVSVTFTEEVSAELGGLTVLDRTGARVDTGDVTQPSGDVVRVALRPDLPESTYIATYRVVSADGHPIAGSWVFAVGERSPLDIDPATVTPVTDPTWDRLGDLTRGITYVATLLAAGGMVFLAFVLDGTAGTRGLRRTVVVASGVGFVAMLAWTATQGAVATGLGGEAAVDPDVLEVVLRRTMGWPLLATTVGLAAIVVATHLRSRAALQTVGFYGSAAVVAGYALWGHAREIDNRWLGIGADVVHTAVAAIWFGGLVLIAQVLRHRGRRLRSTDDGAALVTTTGETVARFSQLAAVSVLLLWIGGATLAWLGTGGVDGLTGSTYGRLVLAKVGVVVVVLGIAGWNRRVLVPAIALDAVAAEEGDEPLAPEVARRWSHLRRAVVAEAAALVAALGLTAVLVDTPPASDDPTGGTRTVAPFDTLVALEQVDAQMQVNVVPGSTGDNDIHISFYDASGLPADVVDEVTLELSLPSEGVEPITREAERAGPGHFLWEGDALAIPGTWTIAVVSRISEFEEEVTELTVPVAR